MSSVSQQDGVAMAMTELGLASELGSGKVRWRTIQESLKGALVTGTGASLTAISVSSDSEWLAFARKSGSISVLKLSGGTGSEIALPLTNAGLSGTIGALFLHKSPLSNTAGYILYAGDAQGTVVSWSFKDEHSSISSPHVIGSSLGGGITALYAVADAIYAAAKDGTRVMKLSLSSGRVIDEFPPSASPPIRAICLAQHINALVVSSQHRHVSVYSLNDAKAVQYLSGESAPLFISVSPHFYNKEYQHILAVSELGEVRIWNVSATSSHKKPLHASTKLKLSNDSSSGTSSGSSSKGHIILNAAFSYARKNTVLVAYGTTLKPHFSDFSYFDESGDFLPTIAVSSTERTSTQENGVQAPTKNKEDKRNVVGAIDAPIAQATFKGAETLMQVDDATTTAENEEDIPLGQLVSKQRQNKQKDKSNKNQNDKQNTSSLIHTLGEGTGKGLAVPRATSATAALVAALSTNDKHQLSSIVTKMDETFVTNTLRQLPVSQVLPLLKTLMGMFVVRASTHVVVWVRNLLIIHQSYLASAPELLSQLSGLYNTVDERLKCFPDLLKLNGRMDLLLAHLKDEDATELHRKRALQSYVEADDDDLDLPDYDEAADEEDDDHDHSSMYDHDHSSMDDSGESDASSSASSSDSE